MVPLRQTTLELTNTLASVQFWIIIFSLIALCFWSGPFGTFEALPGGLRFIYWALVIGITSVLGVWFHALIRVQRWNSLQIISLVGIGFGLSASGIVTMLSAMLLGPVQNYPGALDLFFYSFPSSAAVFLATILFDRTKTPAVGSHFLERPALCKRLKTYPTAMTILALRAQDHYVEVITEQGAELCLMRLSDAIAETKPIRGLQIHRSHWVAVPAIQRLESKGTETFVRITDEIALKVSQPRLKELRTVLSEGS